MKNFILSPKHDHQSLLFPKDFLWGAATSAHQVEGQNIHSDWWNWEIKHQPIDKRSGSADNQYNLFEDDFQLLASLGHNTHRLSIEWARIEPEEGDFIASEIEHYKKILSSLKDKKIKIMLTLNHFTLPLWVSKKGGWTNSQTVEYFIRFIKTIIPSLSPLVDFWITINEPNVLVWGGYIEGSWPPQQKSFLKATQVTWNLASAHRKAYDLIHKVIPNAKVGIAYNVSSYNALHKDNIKETVLEWSMNFFGNHFFYQLTGKTHDFLGLNYYFNRDIDFEGKSQLPQLFDVRKAKKEVSDLGWEIYPQGMFEILMDFTSYQLPIYITENGIASTNDHRRIRFLLSYLTEIYHAIAAGADVRGYIHWSLIDNFEWAEGFEPRFGLIEVDYQTQKRIPRSSAFVYKKIIESNGIPHNLLKLLGHGIDVKKEMEAIL